MAKAPDAKAAKLTDPNKLRADQFDDETGTPRVSMGDPGADKTERKGIKLRGTGIATKGLYARGPMG